ncbi:MAG: hypothetical protein ABEI32_09035 [Halothece sp.]
MSNQFLNPPQGIEVENFNNYIKIKYNIWSTTRTWISIIVCLFFLLIIIFVLLILDINQGGSGATIYFIGFICTIILILFKVTSSIMNITSITVDDKVIIIRKPLSPTKASSLRIVKIAKIFSEVREEIAKAKNGEPYTIYHYQVFARTSNKNNKKIIETDSRVQMLFIEKTLKDYLNIED